MLCRSSSFFVPLRRMAIKAALIDLSGTLHVEDDPTPNAVAALQRLSGKNLLKIKHIELH